MRGRVVPLLGLALFALALIVLRHELRAYQYADVLVALRAVSYWRIAAAVVLTTASYLALTGYDALGLRYLGHTLSFGRIALAAFVGYAFGHSLALAGGGAVRYRLYAGWGLSAVDIAKVLALNGLTFWLGAVGIAGASLAADVSLVAPAFLGGAAAQRMAGGACLALIVLYVGLCAGRRAPIRISSWAIALPPVRLALAQLLLSAIDWMLAASVLYVLLPPADGLTFVAFIGAFVLAQTVGLASSVPGGVGVFETAMVLVLGPFIPGATVLGTLLAYRVIYYLLPLLAAVVLLGAHELTQERAVSALGRLFRPWTGMVAPQMLALTTALGGVTLLLSGATPAVAGRLGQLARVLPLGVVELAHIGASVAGVCLLVVARGLQRRLDVAYLLAVALLVSGSVLSLAKGLDYGEAVLLAILCAALVPSRREFYRRARLFDAPFPAGWVVTVAVSLAATVWLLVLSHHELRSGVGSWWRFGFDHEAARAVRSAMGAVLFASVLGIRRFGRAAPVSPLGMRPAAERTAVANIVARSSRASAHLALLGDKRFLVSEREDAFLMYGVRRRSWVVMGDPVGPLEETRELVWRFRELVDRRGGRPVFYEVGEQLVSVYSDIGLSLMKLGEEARVALVDFDLDAAGCVGVRRSRDTVAGTGHTFAVLAPEAVAPMMGELSAVSSEWLSAEQGVERGFALGRFDAEYVARLPVAVARRAGKVVAFATLWRGAGRHEVAVDLVRHVREAPAGVIDFLLAEVMLWAQAEGVHEVSLGMAPLAGLDERALRPMRTRLGAYLFHLGEHFDDFRTLRAYKEAFGPRWVPRYLATQGGLGVPRALLDVAALIARDGVRRS